MFSCFRFSPTRTDWIERKIVPMFMFTQMAKPKRIQVIILIPKMSSVLKVDLLGALTHLISSFLN